MKSKLLIPALSAISLTMTAGCGDDSSIDVPTGAEIDRTTNGNCGALFDRLSNETKRHLVEATEFRCDLDIACYRDYWDGDCLTYQLAYAVQGFGHSDECADAYATIFDCYEEQRLECLVDEDGESYLNYDYDAQDDCLKRRGADEVLSQCFDYYSNNCEFGDND